MATSTLSVYQQDIVQRYEQGETITALAQSYKTPSSTMKYFLKSICGVTMWGPRRGSVTPLLPVTEQTILATYSHGDTATAIATAHNLTYSHVVSVLRRHGIRQRRRGLPSQLLIPESPALLGYLAGLIDGEGTIRLNTHRTGRQKAVIQISNTDRGLMEWLGALGGDVYWEKRPAPWKPCATWRPQRAIDCYRLLQAVLPYLIVKKAKAVEVLRFLCTQLRLE